MRGVAVPEGTERIDTVGVVGAGVIGTSVAQSLAQTGHDVVLVDVDDAALERSLATLRRELRAFRLVAGGGPGVDVAAALARIRPTTSMDDLRGLPFVIENVTEDWEVKRAVHQAIAEACEETCVVAANTSAIPIARFAGVARHPDQVVGMHFMNPVPLKEVVEVVRGADTSEWTLAQAVALLGQMGKRAVVVGDAPGFVANRVLMVTINEAAKVLESGIASVHDVDEIFRGCFGHAMGPLETADLIGIDTIVRTLDVLVEELPTESLEPCELLRSMVASGRLGRKSGDGFYGYAGGRDREVGG